MNFSIIILCLLSGLMLYPPARQTPPLSESLEASAEDEYVEPPVEELTAEEVQQAIEDDQKVVDDARVPFKTEGRPVVGKNEDGLVTHTYTVGDNSEGFEASYTIVKTFLGNELVVEQKTESPDYFSETRFFTAGNPDLVLQEYKGVVVQYVINAQGKVTKVSSFSMGSKYCRIYDEKGIPRAYSYDTCDGE